MQTNGRRIVHTYLPIHGWSVEEVWARIEQAGTRAHPAYSLGMPRLSCCFCIYSPRARAALMLAGQHNRVLLDRYVEVEEKVGFTFQAGLSLKSVRDALDRGEESGPVRSWEM
jgi:3'-phosphoadenosine 5'-phosphosulfate sulfotransferase (PAPS reductase)/FAD synthetase